VAALFAITWLLSACGFRTLATPTSEPTLAADNESLHPAARAPEATPVVLATLPGRATPPRDGELARDFSLRDLDGSSVTLSDLRGKVVLINFWASWCGPCLIEIPHLVAFHAEHRDQGVEILAVNVLEDRQQVAAFAEKHGMTFPVLLDTRGSVTADYYVRAIPVSVFVDAEGVIGRVHIGLLTEATLAEYVSELTR
jgi:thiol-disulfide isomerase/thioredoxin